MLLSTGEDQTKENICDEKRKVHGHFPGCDYTGALPDFRIYVVTQEGKYVLWFTVAFLQLNPDILDQIDPGHQEASDETRRINLLKQCGVGALLNDIGKAFVSQEIITKSEPLTEVEWEVMKRHPLNGLAMLIDTDIPRSSRKRYCMIMKISKVVDIP